MIDRITQQAADDSVYTEETFRFLALPELWQVALLIAPAVVLFAWWTYGGLTRMAPKTRERPSAVSARTAAPTAPSSEASNR